MFIKCFTKNRNNKIEFTEKELKDLLDEVYRHGYSEGKGKNYWYTSPTFNKWSWPTNRNLTNCCTNNDSDRIITASINIGEE